MQSSRTAALAQQMSRSILSSETISLSAVLCDMQVWRFECQHSVAVVCRDVAATGRPRRRGGAAMISVGEGLKHELLYFLRAASNLVDELQLRSVLVVAENL